MINIYKIFCADILLNKRYKKNTIACQDLNNALEELNNLIGLKNVKDLIKQLEAYIRLEQMRKERGLKYEPLTLHMIFKGNPGTGKTTVARLLGKILKGIGILSKGHVVEVERADLVGEYIGHTAQKVRENVKKAIGGILFIDEAYSLARGGEKDFGKEAIDTLVKAMEDHKNEFILILAGYRDEMEYFLNTNPGLKSRFALQFDFPDYTIDELMLISEKMTADRDYRLTPKAKRKIYRLLIRCMSDNKLKEGNARLVRNIIEKSIMNQALRIYKKSSIERNDLIYIEEEDIPDNIYY
ncbi:MAG: AAA family ATPase [Thermoanaerobacteraceae bacterium]|nr:AAA family ATPase [Thermoanaerobacteraceae bacterium]